MGQVVNKYVRLCWAKWSLWQLLNSDLAVDQRFPTSAPQECLKPATTDCLVRGTEVSSLRRSNKKRTTANTTIVVQCEWIKILPIFCVCARDFSNSFMCAPWWIRLKITAGEWEQPKRNIKQVWLYASKTLLVDTEIWILHDFYLSHSIILMWIVFQPSENLQFLLSSQPLQKWAIVCQPLIQRTCRSKEGVIIILSGLEGSRKTKGGRVCSENWRSFC